MSLAAFCLAVLQSNAAESYTVDRLEAPNGAVLEVGGMDWLDDRLVVSTRRGQVWIVDRALDADPKAAQFHLYCEGLQEGLGSKVVSGEIYVLQRSELSRLRDTDHDGTCDTIDTVCNGWGVSGNYHEFAFGLPTDKDGNFYAAFNLGFTDPKWWHGRSLAPWRGWVVKIARDGTLTPFASGFRSPCGIGTNAAGDLFVTDNQGDWMPVCPLEHVREGQFYGAPASLVWSDAYAKTRTEPSLTNPVDAQRTPPACWIPYKWSRSTGDMRPAPHDGSFGPFEDQLILAELTNGLVFRADLEKVRGEYQGAVMLVQKNVGSAVRTLFSKDGTLLCGLTNRGWGGLAPGHGIARVRYTGVVPFEVKHVNVQSDGFAVELTEPLADALVLTAQNFDVSLYHYDWWWEYGSPERSDGARPVTGIDVSRDRKHVTLHAPIAAGHMARVVLKGFVSKSGRALLHDEFDYTINQLPDGPLCTTPVARVANPPPARETQWEGWLRLTYGDALDLWKSHDGWKLVDAELDPADATKFAIQPGSNALVDCGDHPGDMVSTPVFGDAAIHMMFMVPKGGAGALFVHGIYGIQFCDPGIETVLTQRSCGALLPLGSLPGRAPLASVFRGAGEWHNLDVVFKAARFDADGHKTENARFVRVSIDDVIVHENVEFALLESETKDAPRERPAGSLVISGGRGTCAIADVRVRPEPLAHDASQWTPLMDSEGLEGWSSTDGSTWKREDGCLVSGGKSGWLVRSEPLPLDFELRAQCKISSGGVATLLLSYAGESTDPVLRRFGVRINANHPDPERTGSIVRERWPDEGESNRDHTASELDDLGRIRTVSLVGEDTWFELAVRVHNDAQGRNSGVEVRVNGVLVSRSSPGVPEMRKLAIEQHHEGSVLEVKALEFRALPAR